MGFFGDLFKKPYDNDGNYTVSGRDRVPESGQQLNGVSVTLSDSVDEARLARLKEMRPAVLGFPAGHPSREILLDFCRKEEVHPCAVFSHEMSDAEVQSTAEELLRRFTADDLWTPIRFYAIEGNPENLSLDNDSEPAARAARMKEIAELLRKTDPEGQLILNGILPTAENRIRAEVWNPMVLQACDGIAGLLGVTWTPAFPQVNFSSDRDSIAASAAFAKQFGTALQRLERQIRETLPNSNIQIALLRWGIQLNGAPQAAKDGVYMASLYRQIRNNSAFIRLACCGPLTGRDGLLETDAGNCFPTVMGHFLRMARTEPGVWLTLKEIIPDKKGGPAIIWDGIPGVFDPAEIPLLESSAARGNGDGRLWLMFTNRSPNKRLNLKVRFSDLPEMHPVQAMVLRSKKPASANTPGNPEAVACGEINLGKYRNMDHVNLDIPPCCSVTMVLDAG